MFKRSQEIQSICQRKVNEEETEIFKFISDLKEAGASPILTMKILIEKLNLKLSEAKKITYDSPSWNYLSSKQNQFNEEFINIISEHADEVEEKNGEIISLTFNLDDNSEKKK